jgi:glc operon protein GlcG
MKSMKYLKAFCCLYVGACLFGSPAIAQSLPAYSNPNDTVPDAMPLVEYGQSISTDQAKQVVTAALSEARRRNWYGLCIAIVGPSGELTYFEKQDNCQYASTDIAIAKARTAARFRRATLILEQRMAAGSHNAFLATVDGLIAARGGQPIIVSGKIIGAIGVSGGTGSQDDVIALSGNSVLK